MTGNIYININCAAELFEAAKNKMKEAKNSDELPQGQYVNIILQRLNVAQRVEADKHIGTFQAELSKLAGGMGGQGVAGVRIVECVEESSDLQPDLAYIAPLIESVEKQLSSETQVALLDARYTGTSGSIFDNRVTVTEIEPMFSYYKMVQAISKVDRLLDEAGVEIDMEAIAETYPELFEAKELALEDM